jgi:hypothetical protein
MRQQSALVEATREIVVVTRDKRTHELLGGRKLKVLRTYPDTTDGGVFKIEVELERTVEELMEEGR